MSDKLDAQISISADASGVEAGVGRAKRSLKTLSDSAREVGAGMGSMGSGAELSAKQVERNTRNMGQQLQRHIAALQAGSKDSRKYWEQMADFRGVNKNALRPLLDQLDELKRKQVEAAGASSGLGRALTGLAGVGGAAFALKELSQQAYQAQAALFNASAAAERLKIGLDFASTRGSAAEIAYLRKTTYDLGLQFTSTAQSYMQFQAAAKGTSLEGEKARSVFESIAKASAVMGLSAEQNSGVLLALQQMVSKGTVQAEELRGQLGERLPGAFQIAARSMGVTTAELGKMLEMGQVISDDFLPKFAAELEKSLGDAPEKAANRLDASVNRVTDSWDRLKQNVGDSGVSTFWAGQLNILTDGMGNFNNKVEAARVAGDGFFGQLAAGAGAALEFANPINAIGYSALEAGQKLKDAEKSLQQLKDSGAQSSSNLMLREAYKHAERLVNKLREAKLAQDSLAGVSTPVVGGDPYNDGTQYGAYLDKQKKFDAAQVGLLELSARTNGINKQFTADLQTYADALDAGAMSASEYAKAVTDLNAKRYESTEAGKAEAKALRDSARDAKGSQSSYQSLAKSIQEKLTAQRQELMFGTRLTDIQKLGLKVEQEMTGAKKAALLAQIAIATAQQQELDARAVFLQFAEEEKKARLDLAATAEKGADSYAEANERLREEIELIGISEEAQHAINRARLEAQITVKEQHLAEVVRANDVFGFMSREQIALEDQIRLLRERLGLLDDKKVREANAKAADAATKTWDKVSDGAGQMMSDAIVMGGASALQALERAATAIVLRPAVQVASENLMGALGFGTKDSAAGKSTAASMIQNGHSIHSALTGSLTYGLGSAAASIGTAIGSTAATSFGAGMAASGFTANAFTTGASMVGAGATSTGLGMMAGAALPWVAGGLAVVSLLGGLFGSNPKEHTGGLYSNATDDRGSVLDALNLTKHARGDFTSRQNAGVDTALATTIDGLLESYAGFAKRAAGDVRELSVYAAFATNPISKDEDAYGYMRVIDKLTGEIVGRASRRDGDGLGNDPEKAYSLFTGEIAGVLVKELKAADLPGWMHTVFDSLGDSVTLESYSAAVQQIAQIDAGFLSLGKTMGMFADLSGQMQTSLLGVFGTIDNLTATASSFYNSYYSEAQRMETLAAQVQSALSGLSVQIDPRMGDIAKAQFKEAVEAAFAAGKGELGAQLLAMNQQFATAAEYAAKAAKDMQQAALAAAQNAAEGALANIEAAGERERNYWERIANAAQEAVGKLSGTLSLLTSNAQALYGTVDSTQQMLAAQGMVYIEDALSAVRGGTSITGFEGLQDAITAARGGISNGAYATQFDRDRDTLVLAGQLSQLGELTDSQLSIEERALKAANAQIEQLDKTLEYWQQALDFDAQGIDATLTVAQAVMALGPLISALQLERAGGSYAAAIKAVTPGGEGPKAALYQQMLGSGLTDAQIRAMVDKTTGVQTDSDWDYLKKLAVPGYDVGANYIPNDQLAVLHRGEAVIPEAFNPWAGGVGWGMDMSRMEALMERLLDDNRRQAGEIIRLNARVARLLERWEGGGLPRQREEEAA